MDVTAHLYPFGEAAGETAVLPGILADLREAGYAATEVILGQAEAMIAVPAADRLAIAGVHCTPGDLADLDRVLDLLEELDCRDLVSSGPLLWDDRSYDDWQATAERLNELGTELEAYDIRLHYHNHAFEWDQVETGQTAFDLLCGQLDPLCCDFALDCGWAHLAGQDVSALLTDLGARAGYIHLRDFAGETSCALGAGDIDQAPIVTCAALHCRPRFIAVEMDPPADNDALTPMLDSLAHLRRLGA